jgi:hypothetical protein
MFLTRNGHFEGPMTQPSIKVVKFYPDRFLELAVDEGSGIHLLGIPFDVGGSGHTRYYRISAEDFGECLADQEKFARLERNGSFLNGTENLYWSDYVPDLGLINRAFRRDGK